MAEHLAAGTHGRESLFSYAKHNSTFINAMMLESHSPDILHVSGVGEV